MPNPAPPTAGVGPRIKQNRALRLANTAPKKRRDNEEKMDLNKLKDGADWMTVNEKAICERFVENMREVLKRCAMVESPLLTVNK